MKYGLSQKNIDHIQSILKSYDAVDKAVLYGSRAMGTYKEGSDIDLTFCGDQLNLNILNQIRNDLDDSFLPYKFDLSLFKTLNNQDIIDHIERVGIVFYEKKLAYYDPTNDSNYRNK